MILITIHMTVGPGNRKELSQTVTSLVPAIQAEAGCRACDFGCRMDDSHDLSLFETWDSLADFEKHRESDTFKILSGAMHLLGAKHRIWVYASMPSATELEPGGYDVCILPEDRRPEVVQNHHTK